MSDKCKISIVVEINSDILDKCRFVVIQSKIQEYIDNEINTITMPDIFNCFKVRNNNVN